jgi:hypothetical protein
MTISIVGLLPSQEREVERRTKGLSHKLRFLPSDRKPHFPSSTDHVVLNAKFISHKWTKAAHQQIGRDNVTLHFGGLKFLLAIIREM